MEYAVIKTSGSQFKVKESDELDLDKINLKVGDKVEFKDVLLLVNGENVEIGKPYLSGVVVYGKILEHFKGKKIRVATYKAKSRYRRVMGFRAQLTKVKIEKIKVLKRVTGKKAASKGTKKTPKV